VLFSSPLALLSLCKANSTAAIGKAILNNRVFSKVMLRLPGQRINRPNRSSRRGAHTSSAAIRMNIPANAVRRISGSLSSSIVGG
jgi:hypothetical protein